MHLISCDIVNWHDLFSYISDTDIGKGKLYQGNILFLLYENDCSNLFTVFKTQKLDLDFRLF